MIIVIRKGFMNPENRVVHPVNDDYSDMGAFDKLTLLNDDAYKAFKQLINLNGIEFGEQLSKISEELHKLNSGERYDPEKGKLIERIVPKNAEYDPLGNFLYIQELNILNDILSHIKKMKDGDKSIAIEDRAETPNLGPNTTLLRHRRNQGGIDGAGRN